MMDDPRQPVLALNVGSSSLKFGPFMLGASGHRALASGAEEAVAAPQEAVAGIADGVKAQGLPAPVPVGHRIVHGGPQCRQHTLIDAAVMRKRESATAFAPLHVPPALALVRAAQGHLPGIAQVACLDTEFHAGMPDVARTLPIARELRALGIERYGFHGLPGESSVRQLGSDVPPRLVIAHLGHGASVTAVAHGASADTSMELTQTSGVIMSTRCGDIDPGVLAHVVRTHGYGAARPEELIDQCSGMRGISVLSGDLRQLIAAAASKSDSGASVRKQIAAMAVVLGGADLLVFTGGIGENDGSTRAFICEGLEVLAAITATLQAARADASRPSLILVRTHIGYISPNKHESFEAHAVPDKGVSRLLGRVFGKAYAKWCTNRMARDATMHFNLRRSSS